MNIKEPIKQLEEEIEELRFCNGSNISVGAAKEVMDLLIQALAIIKKQEEEINGLQEIIKLVVSRNPYKEFGVK